MFEAQPVGVWADETTTRGEMPAIWRQLALFSLTFAFLDGFGAYALLYALTPIKYILIQAMLLIATLIVSPRRSLTRVFLPLTSLLFVGWWLLSYTWDSNRAGWLSATTRDLATVVTIVVVSQVLGRDDFVRCLIRSGYIAIGLIFFTLAVEPGLAYTDFGPSPGLRGAFIHKNTMAPCLLVTAAAVLCLHPSRVFRQWFMVIVATLLLLADTTTGLATLVVLVLVNWLLGGYKGVVERLGRSAGSLLIAAGMIATLVGAGLFSSLVKLSGKDMTFSSRTTIWAGVNDAVSHRFWQGYGYGVWENIWAEPVRAININNGFLVAHAHNAALDMMLRLGVIGLALYLLLFLSTFRSGWRGLMCDDAFGRFALLFCAIVVSFGFSEALPAYGLWPALLIVMTTMLRGAKPLAASRELPVVSCRS